MSRSVSRAVQSYDPRLVKGRDLFVVKPKLAQNAARVGTRRASQPPKRARCGAEMRDRADNLGRLTLDRYNVATMADFLMELSMVVSLSSAS